MGSLFVYVIRSLLARNGIAHSKRQLLDSSLGSNPPDLASRERNTFHGLPFRLCDLGPPFALQHKVWSKHPPWKVFPATSKHTLQKHNKEMSVPSWRGK